MVRPDAELCSAPAPPNSSQAMQLDGNGLVDKCRGAGGSDPRSCKIRPGHHSFNGSASSWVLRTKWDHAGNPVENVGKVTKLYHMSLAIAAEARSRLLGPRYMCSQMTNETVKHGLDDSIGSVLPIRLDGAHRIASGRLRSQVDTLIPGPATRWPS